MTPEQTPELEPELNGLLLDVDGIIIIGSATDTHINREAARIAIDRAEISNHSTAAREWLATARSTMSFEGALDQFDIDRDRLWKFREEAADELAIENIRSGGRPPFHDVDVLVDLAEEYPVGLASNSRMGTVEFIGDHVFGDRLEAVVGRGQTFDEFARRKPNPKFLERALAEMSVSPSDPDDSIGYVGDKQKDIIAAQRVGLTSIFIRRPHNLHQSLDPEPDFEFHGLEPIRDLMR